MTDELQSFWDMGGYARFVWPAYAVALGTLLLSAWSARRALREARARARQAARDGGEGA